MAPLRCFQAAASGTQQYSRPVRGTTRSSASTRSVQCQANIYRNDLAETQQHASRRHLLQQIALGATVAAVGQLPQQWPALADEAPLAEAPSPAPALLDPAAASTSGHQRIYLDVRIESKPIGRIVVDLFPDVPVGSARFADLALGKEGVAYRLSKFDGVFDSYIRNEGVKSLSYSANGYSPIAGGDSTQKLEEEMDAPSARRHDSSGLVSLVVKEAVERPVKERLVAMKGKLVTIKEQAGEAPNGTAFAITTGPAPELDKTNLVVGKVVEGMGVLEAIRALPISKPRDEYYNKPFFEAGKAMGDKRAIVAEKGFNRPLKRVLVANAGVSP